MFIKSKLLRSPHAFATRRGGTSELGLCESEFLYKGLQLKILEQSIELVIINAVVG